MIYKGLQLVAVQLSEFIEPIAGPSEVILGNIALAEAPNQNELVNKVIITMVNVEEESTLKNGASYQKLGNMARYTNPPVYMNLYSLISAHYPQSYDISLKRLSSVIKFFQSRNTFNLSNAQPLANDLNLNDPEDMSISLNFELYTLTFEQINHLWGSLGGKQMPSVMYKIRLVAIEDRSTVRETPLIEEIQKAHIPK